jgi:hypothetical protein
MPYKKIGAMSLVDAADYALSEDLLAPLFAGLLFPDFLQRFLPYPFEFMDRGRRLELSFEAAMDVMRSRYEPRFGKTWSTRNNVLAQRFADHWKPEGNVPALIINTTEVETGKRRILSPFIFEGAERSFFPLWNDAPRAAKELPSALSVAAAASLSARFPWVSPAAWFQDYKRDNGGHPIAAGAGKGYLKDTPVRLVDGGYFENSGVATAVELIRAMEKSARQEGFADRIRINLIVLTRGELSNDEFHRMKELLSPVQALLNTRNARAYITIAEAERELNDDRANAGPRVRKVRLEDMGYALPLGWRLSVVTSLLIRAQGGTLRGCSPVARNGPRAPDADCVLDEVFNELSPR